MTVYLAQSVLYVSENFLMLFPVRCVCFCCRIRVPFLCGHLVSSSFGETKSHLCHSKQHRFVIVYCHFCQTIEEIARSIQFMNLLVLMLIIKINRLIKETESISSIHTNT